MDMASRAAEARAFFDEFEDRIPDQHNEGNLWIVGGVYPSAWLDVLARTRS
jgi:hypothetical protein